MSEYMTDRYPYLIWQPTEYCDNCNNRLWKQTLIKKVNDFNISYKCPICNAVIRTEEIRPKKKTEIKPLITLDLGPILKRYEDSIPYSDYQKPSTLKSNDTSLDEDSILFNLFRIIVYVFVDLLLLSLIWKLLT